MHSMVTYYPCLRLQSSTESFSPFATSKFAIFLSYPAASSTLNKSFVKFSVSPNQHLNPMFSQTMAVAGCAPNWGQVERSSAVQCRQVQNIIILFFTSRCCTIKSASSPLKSVFHSYKITDFSQTEKLWRAKWLFHSSLMLLPLVQQVLLILPTCFQVRVVYTHLRTISTLTVHQSSDWWID